MRQSYTLLGLQSISVILGITVLVYVARLIPANLFAIIGVYEVSSGFIKVFSNIGIETKGIRNILKLEKERRYNDIKVIISESIISRWIISLILSPFIFLYIFYSLNNFSLEKTNYIILFGITISAVISSLNESFVLITKGFNRYVESMTITLSTNVLSRIIGLLFFLQYGFEAYVASILVAPLIIFLVMSIRYKDRINVKQISGLKILRHNFRENKMLAYSTYTSFLYNYFDQLLASLLFGAETMGTVTLAKRFLTVGRSSISNFFDPIIQKTVAIRDNETKLFESIRRIKSMRNYLLIVATILFILFCFQVNNILKILELTHYPNIEYHLILIFLGLIATIFNKVNHQVTLLLFKQQYTLHTILFLSISGLIIMSILGMIDRKYLYGYIFLSQILFYFFSKRIVKKEMPEINQL